MALVNCTPEAINETNIIMHCQTPQNHGSLFLQFVMIIEMIVGLPGNTVAMWIFCFRMKFWKPHALFLFNMVIADFLLIISVPFRIDTSLRGDYWVFGQYWCRINLFMLAVNRSASIAFMTAVTVDRYFKVVHPHHRISRMTLTQAGWLVGLLWTVVIALRIPLLTTNLLYQDGNVSLCRSFNSYKRTPSAIKVHYGVFITEFFLPWFLLLFCSARIACSLHQRWIYRRKMVWKATRAVVVISLVFTICFMPGVITGLRGMYIKQFYPDDCASYNLIIKFFMMSIPFTYLNSSLDPVIYCFSSSMFHDALKSSISHLSFVKKNVRPANSTASNS
ncbi:hydroxycarboxylic acid receptor 2-like [Seriola dumerili]|uniref:hydroxycarboxylic acid receptor 2-like n=1 Tax=Seriola dumerili TaxID=41447 RepID=UPI000BBEEA1C|nr:hydroxycarboxylic acid receptor 2-like [Seriola dumerili]